MNYDQIYKSGPNFLGFKAMFPLIFSCVCAQKFVRVQIYSFFAKHVHSAQCIKVLYSLDCIRTYGQIG